MVKVTDLRHDMHRLVFSDVKTLINSLVLLISDETNRSRHTSSNSTSTGRSGELSYHVSEALSVSTSY